ncbi:MAG: succinylglutamate desuccinylase/aspartoacylase family protein [Gemmatimonadetes bacterium]|nr:succinylglutamate desuccinylase/aspartoacylase family protein [Gemmatimonadota bacterium]
MPDKTKRPVKVGGREKWGPISIGPVTASPGELTRLELPFSRLATGTWASIPVAVLHGKQPGPRIWVNAVIHGDELNGVPIIRELVHDIDPTRLRGTVVAVPIVNVFGLIKESRYLPDRRDLNRSFPGSARGSMASQLAHLFMTHIVAGSSLGFDLHTGSDGRTNLPQIRCDLEDPVTAEYADVFGAPLNLHSPLRGGSLRAAAGKMGIPVLVYEGGEAFRFNREAFRVGYEGVRRVLERLGMYESGLPPVTNSPARSHASQWVRARRSGLCQLSVRIGARVKQGDRIAVIYDAATRWESVIRARADGMIIGMTRVAIVHRGDAIVHIASID